MAYTTPTTRATGHIVTADEWNTDLTENVKWLHSPPSARIYATANQSIPASSTAVITLDHTDFDTDSMVGTNRLTCNTAGYYLIMANVLLGNAAGDYQGTVRVRKNGTTAILEQSLLLTPAGPDTNFYLVGMEIMAVTDYIELVAVNGYGSAAVNSGGTVNYAPRLAAVRVGGP